MNTLLKKVLHFALEVKKTTPEIKEKRIQTCTNCEFRRGENCGICGCYYELKAGMDYNRNPFDTMKIEKTHCPKGKWAWVDESGIEHENDQEIADYYNNLNG